MILLGVDFAQRSLFVALAAIVFNPVRATSVTWAQPELPTQTFWNIVAQGEARTHFLTKAFGGHRYYAIYALAATIFTLGVIRDGLYRSALVDQPVAAVLEYAEVKILAAALFVAGSTLVVTSMFKLGVSGTYLGD